MAGIALLEKPLFDLRIDAMEPLLGSLGSRLRSSEFGFQRRNPIFGGPQLVRKLLRHAERVATIFVGDAGGLRNQLQDGLTRLVELIVRARGAPVASSHERNDLWFVSELTMHCTPPHAVVANVSAEISVRGGNTPARSFLFGGVASLQHQHRFFVDCRLRSQIPNRKQFQRRNEKPRPALGPRLVRALSIHRHQPLEAAPERVQPHHKLLTTE
jgi:hypothetical protein